MPPLSGNSKSETRNPKPGSGERQSLEQLAATPEFRRFVEDKFPAQAPLLDNPVSRRRFCQLMGASLGLAGLTGCDWPFWPEQKLAPEVQRPANRVPGVPVHYATAFELAGVAEGLLVKSVDGRPVKVEGNPQHPFNRGASSAFAQALVLELYDPGRSQTPLHFADAQQNAATWDEFAAFMKDVRAKNATGKGFHILSEASSSVTLADMRARLEKALPDAKWWEYEPVSRANQPESGGGSIAARCRLQCHLAEVDTVVCFDADILGTHPAAIQHARDFATRRNADQEMSRLYVVESGWTITGAMADVRIAVRPSEIPSLYEGLLADLHGTGGGGQLPELLKRAAGEMRSRKERSLIILGEQYSSELQSKATRWRHRSAQFDDFPSDAERVNHVKSMAALADALAKGEVDTLLILGGNPVYNTPADLDFAEKLKKVPNSIHLSLYDDETSRLCAWHLPRAHALESWGDARTWDGTITLQQPLIEPLYSGRTLAEVLALVLGEPPFRGYEIVRRALGTVLKSADFEASWKKVLHNGFLPSEAPVGAVGGSSTGSLEPYRPQTAQGLEVLFVPDYRVHDGRFANNGWLQEMPDPITKLTWDNAALISPLTAKAQNVAHGDMVKIELDGRALEIPAFVLPGIADDTIILPLGYGRNFGANTPDSRDDQTGRNACPTPLGHGVGFNTYVLRTTKAMYSALAAKMTRTGATHAFARTQDQSIVSEVAKAEAAARVPFLIRSADVAAYKANPKFAQEMSEAPEHTSLFSPPHEYTGHRWGMLIDLSICSGCSACTIACQAENNVPVVGKDQVIRGRRMHWLRVDAYAAGDATQPRLLFQPVPCMQCETAPCEQVCPVGATVHSAEGLNEMTYNRCVGTRYCSNNCPYKVRRFNWYNNHLHRAAIEKMVFNPDVTVRSRGVMEKCTYCVQRIEQARIAARLAKQPIQDGAIVPACAQACPAGAIVFGDLNDPASRVAKLATSPRAYGILEQLNTRPRTKYLAKIRNAGPSEAGA